MPGEAEHPDLAALRAAYVDAFNTYRAARFDLTPADRRTLRAELRSKLAALRTAYRDAGAALRGVHQP